MKLEKEVYNVRDTLLKMKGEAVKLTLKIQEPILDDAERKYLGGVIKPFRNKIKYIQKIAYVDYTKNQYLRFCMKNEPSWTMPLFEPNTIYKGMELNKQYSLDELEL